MKYFNITIVLCLAIIAAIFFFPPPQNSNAACNPPDGEDCCPPSNIVTCIDAGSITGLIENASEYVCWNPDGPVTLFATASGTDLCGTQQVVSIDSYCIETTNYVPVCGEVTYRWEITGPDSTNGVGPDAHISTTNCGIYTATFYLDVDRDCPPSTFTLSTNLYLVKPEIDMERYIGIDLSPFPKGTNSASGSVEVCPDIATNYSWSVAPNGVFNPEPEPTDTSVIVEEQGEPSSSYLEEILAVTVSPSGCSVETNFTIVEVDISLQGKDEEDEIEKGGNVPSNHDDDNYVEKLYIQDMFEQGPISNETDLVMFTITLTPEDLPDEEFVTLEGIEDMYEDNEKATNAAAKYPVSRFPLTLYIDGQEGDASVKEHVFSATHDESGAKDEIKYTYIQADVDLPFFGPKTSITNSIDPEIAEFSDDTWGTYLILNDDDDTAANLNWDFQDGTDIKTGDDSRILSLVNWKPHDPGDDYDANVSIDWDQLDKVAVFKVKYSETGELEEVFPGDEFDIPGDPELVLYAEGKKVSDDMKDIEMTFTYTRDSAESIDKIKVTVVSVDIDGDSNHDSIITDDDDEVENSEEYPVAVMFNDDDDDSDDVLDNKDDIVNGGADVEKMTDIYIREVLPLDIPQGVVTVSGMENVRLFRPESSGNGYAVLTNDYDLWNELPITLKAEGVTPGQDTLIVKYEYFGNNGTNGPAFAVFDDRLIAEAFRVDMDIDSDHTANIEGGIERSELEDAIESGGLSSANLKHLSRKYIVVNDYYDDNSGVPGYADNQTVPGGPVDNGVFVPMKFQPYGCLNESNSVVRFSYTEGSFEEGTEEDETIYTPGGSLRLWKKPQGTLRNTNSVVVGGDFIPANTDIPLDKIGSGEIDLYVEGFTPSDNGLGTEIISVSVANDSSRANGSASAMDEIKCTIIKVDIDIDSNNDDDFDPPEQNLAEDHYEDIENDNSRPGKSMCVNDDDDDDDGIPDFADGYNLDGIIGNNDDTPAPTEKFVPVIFKIPEPIDIDTALINITYDSSDPQMVTINASGEYILPTGSLRIWTKKGHLQRIATKVVDSGDFVPAGTSTAVSLGFTDSNRSQEWYMEATSPSGSIADKRILFEVDPDGVVSGKPYPEFIAADAVRMTIINVDLDGLSVYDPKLENAGNAEIKYKVDGPASGFTPRLELTVMDGADEVACIVRQTEASPAINTEVTKSWDGKWGIKKDGTDTANKGKYADPKKYKMELKIYADAVATTAICTKEYDLFVVRLGVTEIGFESQGSNELFPLQYHLSDPNDLLTKGVTISSDHYRIPQETGALEGLVWRMGEETNNTANVDITEGAFAGLARLEPVPYPETFFPPMDTGTVSVVENDSFNYPICYKTGSRIKLKVRTSNGAYSQTSDSLLGDNELEYSSDMENPVNMYVEWGANQLLNVAPGDNQAIDPDEVITFESAVGDTLVDNVCVQTINLKYRWTYSHDGQEYEIPGFFESSHRAYLIIDTPKEPWVNGVEPWIAALDYAVSWAENSVTETDCASDITATVNQDLGFKYDMVGGDLNYGYQNQPFKLTNLLLYFKKGDNISTERYSIRNGLQYLTPADTINCSDCSCIVTVFNSILGNYIKIRHIDGPTMLNEINAIGQPSFGYPDFGKGFSYHAFNVFNGTNIYDACLRVGQPDPTITNSPRAAMLPLGMPFNINASFCGAVSFSGSGNGSLTINNIYENAIMNEDFSAECLVAGTNGYIFALDGQYSSSGLLVLTTNALSTETITRKNYDVVELTLKQGSVPFDVGDKFEFSTTYDYSEYLGSLAAPDGVCSTNGRSSVSWQTGIWQVEIVE